MSRKNRKKKARKAILVDEIAHSLMGGKPGSVLTARDLLEARRKILSGEYLTAQGAR